MGFFRRLFLSSSALALGACAGLRWSGYREPSASPGAEPVPVSTEPAEKGPDSFTKEELGALYYYDLGSARLDVSRYPEKQQKRYVLFARVCSRCHTLARPINSPRSGYWAWEYYVFRMRMRAQFEPGAGFTPDEAREILDFLKYDSKVRKEKDRETFEQTQQKLQRRFDRILRRNIRGMQEGPRIGPKPD